MRSVFALVIACTSAGVFAQPLPQQSELWDEIGIPFDPSEPGWSQSSENCHGYDLSIYEKGQWAVSFYPDGQLASATHWGRWDAAARKARPSNLSPPQIVSEAQAYAKAQEFLLSSGLWREGSQNDHCILGITGSAPMGHNALLNGKCVATFIAPTQGVLPVEGGRITVVLDRFNSDVVDLLVEHPLTISQTSPTITLSQARVAATDYVESEPAILTSQECDSMLQALPTANLFLTYVRRPIAGSPWNGVLVYQGMAAGFGVEVHAGDSSVQVAEIRGGHRQETPSSPTRGISQIGSIGVGLLVVFAATVGLRKRRRHSRST